jgi:uncharacterized protein (DUF302 family)
VANILSGPLMVDDLDDAGDAITKLSPLPVNETVKRFLEILESHGLKVFAVIDQRAEARSVGLELRETTLVIFGNPMAGTPVMESAPLSALDLPLKVLVWADGAQTKVSYAATDSLMARYHIPTALRGNLSAIDAFTDTLIADPKR